MTIVYVWEVVIFFNLVHLQTNVKYKSVDLNVRSKMFSEFKSGIVSNFHETLAQMISVINFLEIQRKLDGTSNLMRNKLISVQG